MARRCVTTPGPGRCCQAMSQGIQPGATFRIQLASGAQRCAVCHVVQRTHGRGAGFQFRFVRSSVCGIGPSGCAALASTTAAGTSMAVLGGQGFPLSQNGVPVLH